MVRMAAYCALSIAVFAPAAWGVTLQVGVGRQFTTLGAAAAAAKAGDTVDVYPGSYSQGAIWYANNLLIELAPGSLAGSVTIHGTVNNKGVFDIRGDDVVVDGLRFTNASSTDYNGAGIRAEGHNITVRSSSFYANQMGMLITPIPGKRGGSATIINCDFDFNGFTGTTAFGHALYGNDLGYMSVTGSKFTRQKIGHYVKSRALTTDVQNNMIDDTNGTASYLVNIPQGGAATVSNNILIKGINATNCCIAISYGEEMHKGGAYVNSPGVVTIESNNFTNYSAHRVDFVANKSTPLNPVALVTNTLVASAGSIVPLYGAGTVN